MYAGTSLTLRVRPLDARRFGLTADDIATAVNAAMLGQTASTVLEGDRVVNIRVKADSSRIDRLSSLRTLPIRAPNGTLVQLDQVVDISEESGQLELRREDMRQDVAVTGRLEGRDLGSAMAEIRDTLSRDQSLPAGTIEYGILMLDYVEHLRADGLPLDEALVRSGRRRLRPVLMTSMAAALGMLPLAVGFGSGADMLEPLAIAVIGALGISVVLSLVATPTVFFLLHRSATPAHSAPLLTPPVPAS